MKTIAVDLDDTLNDFTATLQGAEFVRGEAHALSEETFQDYLAKLRRGWDGGGQLVSTEYTFFRYKIHHECYQRARARPDGVAFLRWLRQNGWRIVICTHRDLRRAQASTRAWLAAHEIPFDHLFMAGNKIVFCRLWGIAHLIDDDAFAIAHGERHGVSVYHPAAEPGPLRAAPAARGFRSFGEIIPWIQG
jgi:uncharacterized HAD superfamily protein